MHSSSDEEEEEEEPPLKKQKLTVNGLSYHHKKTCCTYCRSGETHPLFLYVLTDKRIAFQNINHKKQIAIGLSSQPFVHVQCQNRIAGYKAGWKATKAVAPNWQIVSLLRVHVNGKKYREVGKRMKNVTAKTLVHFIHTTAKQNNTDIFCIPPIIKTKLYYYYERFLSTVNFISRIISLR